MAPPTTSPQDSKAEGERQAAAEDDLERRRKIIFARLDEKVRPWKAKLLGKKLVDKTSCEIDENKQAEQEFSVTGLPAFHRIIGFDCGEYCDEEEERLTIYLDKEGVVESLRFG